MKISYYTRPGCGLCEEGLLIVKMVQQEIPFELEILNIEEDEVSHQKYMLMIPVVAKGQEVLQYGQLDFVTIFEALDSREI